jgi:hypothetical protein
VYSVEAATEARIKHGNGCVVVRIIYFLGFTFCCSRFLAVNHGLGLRLSQTTQTFGVSLRRRVDDCVDDRA